MRGKECPGQLLVTCRRRSLHDSRSANVSQLDLGKLEFYKTYIYRLCIFPNS